MLFNLKYRILFFFILLVLILSIIFLLLQKKEISFIKFKLITSTHTDLPWKFTAVKNPLEIKVGEVTNVEYIVENLSDTKTSGIATFSYYPRELKYYITKIDCFCYDSKILKPNEKRKFVLTMVIDPKVTKDPKTRKLEEAIIQFIFFNSKNYKESKS